MLERGYLYNLDFQKSKMNRYLQYFSELAKKNFSISWTSFILNIFLFLK